MQGIDYTFCELREKEVINIADGRRLGRIIDLGMHCSGRIVGVIVPGEKKFFKNLTGCDNIFIPWKNVLKIGDDVILIELIGACNMEAPPPQPPAV
ncbi:MAG: YlmC/YmxH family sporulation protein [Bacillota bacterium]